MKKFLAVFDDYKISKSTLEFAIQLTQTVNAHLVGIFLDEIRYHRYNTTKVRKNYKDFDTVINKMNAKDKVKRDETAQLFQKACGKAGIQFSMHRISGIALQELKHESMFADLLIINEYENYIKYKEDPPSRFIKDLLSDVQCPVLVVPNSFKPVEKIVLLYDGGPAALYAVKMFSYLFGNFQDLPVEVFTVKDYFMATSRVPDNKLMREFIKRHFPKAIYRVVKGSPEEQIIGHLRNHKENELVVLGAYRRSELSRWFKTSMADTLMKELDTPLFIAHNK